MNCTSNAYVKHEGPCNSVGDVQIGADERHIYANATSLDVLKFQKAWKTKHTILCNFNAVCLHQHSLNAKTSQLNMLKMG